VASVPAALNITEFRRSIGPTFSEAVQRHRPVKIDRGARESGVLFGAEEARALVANCEFHPEVYREEEAVSIWLPEFALYGRGASFSTARDDLIAEVRNYVEEYLDEVELYSRAPNRASHFPFVIRAWLSDASDELVDVLFAPPAAAAA
jgi:Antitoxin of toxin-antitoxin, RelE / RelB, TA system